ncbi:unknown [Acidiphilium sp. CAG:727]|nr:unknown [Acidiphilium sp. CAG:727]
MRLFENILSQTNSIYKENERKRLLFSIKSYILCQTRIIRTLPKRENNEDKIEEDFVPQPLNPKTIPADIQKSIKSDYIYYNEKLDNKTKDSEVKIKYYYGKYNDSYIVILKGPFGYFAVENEFSVNGYNYSYTQSEFMVWRK